MASPTNSRREFFEIAALATGIRAVSFTVSFGAHSSTGNGRSSGLTSFTVKSP